MVWVGGTQYFDNGAFGATINFRDIIARPFSSHLQALEVKAPAVNNRSGSPGRLDGGIKHRVHMRVYFQLAKAGF
jgi:hypothetical protein